MNKELRTFLEDNNIITKKITIRNNVTIIDTGTNKLVIKKRDKDLNRLYKYLSSRAFDYYPKIISQTNNYDIYEYIEEVDISIEEKAMDIIKILTLLHSKTTFYKDIDDDTYKEIYESITDRVEYLSNYYDDITTIIESEEYMSPSNYLFIRNVTKVFQALNYCKYNIDKWYDIIKEKKRVRIVNIHNNLDMDHYIVSSNHPVLISWNKSKKDMPIYDLVNMYKKYYNKLDFYDLLKNYEHNYPLFPEEKILLFILISVPPKINFDTTEYHMCLRVKEFYDYIFTSEKLIDDYEPKEKNISWYKVFNSFISTF